MVTLLTRLCYQCNYLTGTPCTDLQPFSFQGYVVMTTTGSSFICDESMLAFLYDRLKEEAAVLCMDFIFKETVELG